MPISISLIVEILLCGLLVATLIYCALLERKLTALRKGQDGLKRTLSELNDAILSAGSSMRMLKSAASGAGDELDQKVSAARAAIDELSLLTASGERIAARIERGTEGRAASLSPAPGPDEPPRPRVVRPALSDALGGVR